MGKQQGENAPAPAGFEKELARLEEIVGKLESGAPGLDEALRLYEQGAACLKACQKKLAEAEARIKQLAEGPAGPELKDYDPETAGAAGADAGSQAEEGAEAPAPGRRRSRRPRSRGLF